MNRLELEINPFAKRIVATGIDKKEREERVFYVDQWYHEETLTLFNMKYIVFLKYDKRLEAVCIRLDDEGLATDQEVLTKVKIILTDNESTFI